MIDLSSLNGTNGFVLNGMDASDVSGHSVSSAGDVNGDGIDDLIIGAINADPNGNSNAGESYVIFGRANSQRWINPTGGSWDTGPNWSTGAAPSGAAAAIDTPIGVTVSGPAGAVFLDALVLGATLGQTTLELQANSLVSVVNAFNLSSSAALSGAGTFVSNGLFTNNGLVSLDGMSLLVPAGLTNVGSGVLNVLNGFIQGDIANSAEIKLQTLSLLDPTVQFDLVGSLSNEAGAEIFIRGAADLETTGGLTNSGTTSIAFASATLAGPITNAGIPDGMGGFTPLGLVSISGASQVVLTDDVLNQSDIVLTIDSSLVILGTLSGNGVAGPGGGAGGTVFLEGGFNPGFALATVVASFGGDLNLGIANTTTIDIGGTTAGADHDQIATLANLGAGGDLQVTLINGFTPSPGDEYQVLDFATVSGSFSSIILDQALIDAGADTSNLLITGVIVIPGFCFGDANGDGVVNFGDITSVLSNWLGDGSTGGDANDDGVVNFGDITSVLGNWLSVCP